MMNFLSFAIIKCHFSLVLMSCKFYTSMVQMNESKICHIAILFDNKLSVLIVGVKNAFDLVVA